MNLGQKTSAFTTSSNSENMNTLRRAVLLCLLGFVGVAFSAEKFEIVVTRTAVKGGLVSGTISVNGEEIGKTFENAELKIAAGEYKGVLRYSSPSNHAQGPFGSLAKEGDFLLEIAKAEDESGKVKTDVLFHGGNKPHQSRGCILLGSVNRDKQTGGGYIPEGHPLRKLRELFYGTENPTSTPNKEILITIVDKAKG